MNIQTCDPDRLDAFVRSELSEQQENELTLHLDQCAGCGKELERRVAAADQWREASELLTQLKSTSPDIANSEEAASDRQMEHFVSMLTPTDDPEMLGRIGGYEVSGVIGCGGMGVVFKAHDRSLDRVVAIKVMAPHLAGSGAARKRFARESKAAAAVLHPNVIAIHSVADDPKLPYLVMPYVAGTSLQKRIEADGPLCTQDTLRIGQQIAAGLAAAHAQGLVHRDIKPANILLERGVERITITDFGLARAVDDATMTRSGVIAGTPQYMSPEQARGESIDHRSDLFSLGSVLYSMCTGHSPFRAETTFGILRRITDNKPRPIREVNSDVPEWLCAIIVKLHAKEPSKRFQSAEEVAELLEDCLAHIQQPTTALPQPVAELAKSFDSPSRSAPSLGGFHFPRIGKLIAAAVFAFSIIFAGVLIVLELNKGTLTIETNGDLNVPIRILEGDNLVEQLIVTENGATTRLQAGRYVIEIDEGISGYELTGDQVTLKRGENWIAKITKASSKGNVGGDSKLETLPPEALGMVARDKIFGVKSAVVGMNEVTNQALSTGSLKALTSGRLGRFGTLKVIKPVSLVEAVRKFNQMAKTHDLGRSQPELSVDEMIGAFRLWVARTECNGATRKDFKQIIDSQMLQPGHTIQFSTKYETDGHLFSVWAIGFGDDESYPWLKIRNVTLLSRLKSSGQQKAWEQNKEDMAMSFNEFKRSGKAIPGHETDHSHDQGKVDANKRTKEQDQYLFWTASDTVRLSDWFAKPLRLDDERLASVNELLKQTWSKYMKLEGMHTEYSRTLEGHLKGVVGDFADEQSKLDDEFWDKLDAIVDGDARASLHALSTQRGDGIGDDAWPVQNSLRGKAFPSILGWNKRVRTKEIEIWRKGAWYHYRIVTSQFGNSGEGETLPPELQHYWEIGSERTSTNKDATGQLNDQKASDAPSQGAKLVENPRTLVEVTLAYNGQRKSVRSLFGDFTLDNLRLRPYETKEHSSPARTNFP